LQVAIYGLNETQRFVCYEVDDQLWLKRRIALGFVDAASLCLQEKDRLDYNCDTERSELFALWQRVQKARVQAESAS